MTLRGKNPTAPVSQCGLLPDDPLLQDIRLLIEQARSTVAIAVNVGLTMMYWRIGKRIQNDVLKSERANYGDEIVSTLSRQLTMENGNGFSAKNLWHMFLNTLLGRKHHAAIELSRKRLESLEGES